ncbi:MAG: YdcF family protein [Synergistaceae bacterium]
MLLYKLIGSIIAPPGLLIPLLILMAILSYRKPRKKILAFFLLLTSVPIWFISTPYGAYNVTGKIEDKYDIPKTLPTSNTYIVCLGGGSSYDKNGKPVQPAALALERVFTAVKIAKQIKAPIIFSGGNVYGVGKTTEAQIMAKAAKEMGYTGKVILEEQSRTTKENFKYIAQIVPNEQNVIVVTNAFHLSRSEKLAKQYLEKNTIIPYPSGRLTDPIYKGTFYLYPDSSSFMTSCLGIREWIGIGVNKIIK